MLRLIGEGLSDAEIAEHLVVSTSTVTTHINNLFAKLELRDRVQAVRSASRVPAANPVAGGSHGLAAARGSGFDPVSQG